MPYQVNEYRFAENSYPNSSANPKHWPRRLVYFLSLFLPLLLVTEVYIFSQPAVYVSSAIILATPGRDTTSITKELSQQHISIQKALLLGPDILKKTIETVPTAHDPASITLAAEQIADTNLLKLSATGHEPQALQNSLEAWIKVYQEARSDYATEISKNISGSINQQLSAIDQQIKHKRQEIAEFRKTNDIADLESNENENQSRLNGLIAALNQALSQAAAAKAELDAMRNDIAAGKIAPPEDNSIAMSVLMEQAARLSTKLADLHGQYTDNYIQLNPALRAIPEQLSKLEAQIAAKNTANAALLLQQINNQYMVAHQSVLDLQQQLAVQKNLIADHSSQFSAYQALQQALSSLESQQSESKQRLIDTEIQHQQKYPPVEIISTANLPDQAISPNYWQQAALGFAACLSTGLLFVWIIGYLCQENKQNPMIKNSGSYLYQESFPAITEFSIRPTLSFNAAKVLTNDRQPRELTADEINMLYQHGDQQTKQIIALLLNGLSITEILSLTAENFDSGQKLIEIPLSARKTAMNATLLALLAANPWETIAWSEPEIDAQLNCAAIDNGLTNPEHINAQTISFSYRLFLIRQGIKFSDLPKIIGSISPIELAAMGKYAPNNASLPLAQVNLDLLNPE